MNIIRNLPGPLLIFLGALSLSFGGLLLNPLREQHYGKSYFGDLCSSLLQF